MKTRSINRNIRRSIGRGISEVLRSKEGFVVICQRPFYIYEGNLCSPFSEDLIFVSNYLSKNDYFKYFKQIDLNQSKINFTEIFNNFMKIEFAKDPQKYMVNFNQK